MENKEIKLESTKDIKDAFTSEEVKKVLLTIDKCQDLIGELLKNRAKFEDTVIKKIKQQEIVINILMIINIITISSIFFFHKNI